MKTVILAWTQNVCNLVKNNVDNFWGLGDTIRGTIKLYQLSKKMNFNLIVDVSLHPIAKYLNTSLHEFSDFVQDNKDKIPFIYPGEVENFIQSSKESVICLFTNDIAEEPVSNDCKEFIKGILTPNDNMNQLILLTLQQIGYDNFNIIHFRLGDSEIVRNYSTVDYNIMLSKLLSYLEKNSILISDSVNFKSFIKEKNIDIKMIDSKLTHLGYHSESIEGSVLEFFITSKSSKIKTYSINSWISGYVYWTSLLWDIPLESIPK